MLLGLFHFPGTFSEIKQLYFFLGSLCCLCPVCSYAHSLAEAKPRLMKTALKFRASNKHKESKKPFYTKTLSKSKHKVQVTGGKNLAETGAYTPGFCRAVIGVWEDAMRGWTSFTKHPNGDYKSISARCFKNSTPHGWFGLSVFFFFLRAGPKIPKRLRSCVLLHLAPLRMSK